MSETLAAISGYFRRTPDHVALIGGGETLTYGQLDEASARLAGLLSAEGAGPGRTVGLYLPQGLPVIVGMIAALRVGAAWVVIEPDRPVSRLNSLLNRTDCAAIVHLGQKPPVDSVPLIDYGTPGDVSLPVADVDRQQAAYLIFTSGSTGEPKAAMVSRANLDVAMVGLRETFEPGTVALTATSVSYDALLGCLFPTLTTGGTFILADARELVNPAAVAELATRHRITRIEVGPAFWPLLLDRAESLPDTIKTVVTGGEVLTPALAARLRAALPRARLLNAYGPSETTITCTLHQVTDSPQLTVPIGQPLTGVSVYVLDDQLKPVPPGQVGELYVGGDYVGLGYAGDPQQTAHRFVADPGRRAARMYRTGDLAAIGTDGELTFHGRVDDQVKVRGVRIELGEIEHVLQTHDGVKQAAVIRDVDGLVAFFVGAAASPELRAHCARNLVEQAVPDSFVSIERVPLTQNGKTDRAALRKLVPTPTQVPDVPGWTEQQRAVAVEWGAVLRHHDAGLTDRFWEIGGTSLKLMDLYERLDVRWPGLLRVGELFELDTIEAQASAIAARGNGAGTPRAKAPMFKL